MIAYQPGSIPCQKSAGTFSQLFVIEPSDEGNNGGY